MSSKRQNSPNPSGRSQDPSEFGNTGAGDRSTQVSGRNTKLTYKEIIQSIRDEAASVRSESGGLVHIPSMSREDILALASDHQHNRLTSLLTSLQTATKPKLSVEESGDVRAVIAEAAKVVEYLQDLQRTRLKIVSEQDSSGDDSDGTVGSDEIVIETRGGQRIAVTHSLSSREEEDQTGPGANVHARSVQRGRYSVVRPEELRVVRVPVSRGPSSFSRVAEQAEITRKEDTSWEDEIIARAQSLLAPLTEVDQFQVTLNSLADGASGRVYHFSIDKARRPFSLIEGKATDPEQDSSQMSSQALEKARRDCLREIDQLSNALFHPAGDMAICAANEQASREVSIRLEKQRQAADKSTLVDFLRKIHKRDAQAADRAEKDLAKETQVDSAAWEQWERFTKRKAVSVNVLNRVIAWDRRKAELSPDVSTQENWRGTLDDLIADDEIKHANCERAKQEAIDRLHLLLKRREGLTKAWQTPADAKELLANLDIDPCPDARNDEEDQSPQSNFYAT